jgi:hypothetical protein
MAASRNPFDDEDRTVTGEPFSIPARPQKPALAPPAGGGKPAAPKSSGTPTVTMQKVGGTGGSSAQLPKVGGTGASATQLPKIAIPTVIPPVTTPKGRFASGFGEDKTKKFDAGLGRDRPSLTPRPPSLSQLELQAVAERIDGSRPSPSVEIPAAQLAPLEFEATSFPGDRNPILTRAVLDQFAPETNARYEVGECGHVFVWDFTSAMGCPTPRWKGKLELSMAQVGSWFRSLSTDAGWIRLSPSRAAELALTGAVVVALPKGSAEVLLAVARPDELDEDGGPLLATACSRQRGNKLTVRQAFGQRHADYFYHP